MNSNPKYKLRDVTFLIPVRIDSEERKMNLMAVISILTRDFDSSIIVLEADQEQKIRPDEIGYPFEYHFIYDTNPIYYKTKYVNQLLRFALTTYAVVWDVDVIGNSELIEKAIEKLRAKECFLALPYDGRVFSVDRMVSNLYRQTLKYYTLKSHIPKMGLMYGFYSTGGVYMVNKDEFLNIGGENENIYGWGPEDIERIKRLEVFGLSVLYEEGEGLFHLWHPRKNNSWYANKEIELRNRREFLHTCQSNKEDILLRLKSYN